MRNISSYIDLLYRPDLRTYHTYTPRDSRIVGMDNYWSSLPLFYFRRSLYTPDRNISACDLMP